MEKAATSAQAPSSPERIIEALSTLAALLDRTINEVKKNLDKDIQERVLQAVHETESLLQSQAAEHVERARKEVQEQLTTRFQQEAQTSIEGVRSEFNAERERLNKELMLTKERVSQLEGEKTKLIADVQHAKDAATGEIEKIRSELNSKSQKDVGAALETLNAKFAVEQQRHGKELAQATETAARLEAEKTKLIAELQQAKETALLEIDKTRKDATAKAQADLQAAVETHKVTLTAERGRFEKELHHAVEAASKFEAERSGLINEMQRVKDEAAAAIEKARAEAKAAVAKAPAAPPAAPGGAAVATATIQQEIVQAEEKLKEILKVIDDPQSALSAVIRKNVEKSEVEAYLRGIRYVLSGGK